MLIQCPSVLFIELQQSLPSNVAAVSLFAVQLMRFDSLGDGIHSIFPLALAVNILGHAIFA